MFLRRALARTAKICIPRILMGSRARAYVKNLAGIVPPWERNLHRREMPVDPWAFIRVYNEIRTLKQALNSIEGVINKGVIAFHGCTDGSAEYVHEFCDKHPGFKPYEYPYEVVPAGDARYGTGDVPYENSLAAYYNAVFDLIPVGSWFIKVDADMICNPFLLKKSFYLPRDERDMVIYSRLDLIHTDKGIQVVALKRPGDQWLMYKTQDLKFINVQKIIDGVSSGHEVLLKGRKNIIAPELSWLHFPFEKSWRSTCPSLQTQGLNKFFWRNS